MKELPRCPNIPAQGGEQAWQDTGGRGHTSGQSFGAGKGSQFRVRRKRDPPRKWQTRNRSVAPPCSRAALAGHFPEPGRRLVCPEPAMKSFALPGQLPNPADSKRDQLFIQPNGGWLGHWYLPKLEPQMGAAADYSPQGKKGPSHLGGDHPLQQLWETPAATLLAPCRAWSKSKGRSFTSPATLQPSSRLFIPLPAPPNPRGLGWAAASPMAAREEPDQN